MVQNQMPLLDSGKEHRQFSESCNINIMGRCPAQNKFIVAALKLDG